VSVRHATNPPACEEPDGLVTSRPGYNVYLTNFMFASINGIPETLHVRTDFEYVTYEDIWENIIPWLYTPGFYMGYDCCYYLDGEGNVYESVGVMAGFLEVEESTNLVIDGSTRKLVEFVPVDLTPQFSELFS
jgi:hypothetical protein